ncbi:MAG TPA: lipoyl(octanoyl) transferase LipB [Gemmatimonadaceae bacterium]|nr:lipoyl(octanoyl) transferase LipB [Gemmatimonadaceae bacterium]
MDSPRPLLVTSLGTLPYAEALDIQRAAARARIDGSLADDLLLLVEHPAVVTTGRSTKAAHVLLTPEAFAARGVELFDVDRGGDVTFHGPGQIVGYPIVDLQHHKEDLHWYLRQLEAGLIRALAEFEIVGERSAGQTGVWTSGRKIASIGVHARQWVTWHGFALNVTTDLSYFDMLVPCGIANVTMTSIEQELLRRGESACLAPSPALMEEAREAVVLGLSETFRWSPREYPFESLKSQLAMAANS